MGTTTKYGLPYPELTDVANVPADIRELAEATVPALDSVAAQITVPNPYLPYRMAAGAVTMPAVPANGGSALVVTFPAGRFTQPPIVSATAGSNGYGAASIGGLTASGITVKYYNPTASAPSTPTIHWVATQMTSTGGGGLSAEPTSISVVTCHTEGCNNAEIPIDLDLTYIDADGIPQQIGDVACGVCSQPITDGVTA